MGFLDSLTDAFTGNPAKEAAAKTQDYLRGVQNSGNAAIGTGLTNATGYINDATAAARGALTGGYDTATGAVNTGATNASDALNAGYGTAGGWYDAARADYQPLADLGKKYGGATTLALNSLGVNGQAGTDAARAAFQTGPAYDFNLTQGLEAINRRRNQGGMLDSGNADRDAQVFGAGQASNEYDKWLNNLLGFTNPELQATSGAASGLAGVNQNQAGAATQLGQDQAGVATGRAAMLSDLASRYGRDTAGLETGAGNTLAGLETNAAGQRVNLGTTIAKPYADTYGQEAAAAQQGSGNLWNLVGGLATGGANLYGKLNAPSIRPA